KHSQAKHSVAWLHMPNSCPDRRDDPANLVSENAGIRRFTRIKRERLEHVTEIHARGPHVDDHFARTAHPLHEGSEVQGLEVAAFTGFEAQRHRRIKRALDVWTSAVESRDVTSLATKRDLALGDWT